ncbi:hypothetical protein FRB90_000936 [Tulasnella sp. 427]|nr:hypothetical protein FRB90_000936 [Tulasnella sp. 427]
MDDCEGRTSSGMEVSTGGMERGRTTSRGLSNTLILARTNAQPTQRLKPSRIALPPFMGPLPLPSPLPSGSLWSASSETPTDEDGHTSAGNTTPFRFGSGKDVRSGGGHVIYNSVGTPSEGSPTANRHPRPLRLYNTNVGPRLRSTRLHTQLASPSSPSTPSSEATVVNLNSGGGGFPPLYAPANRPLLPLSARTSLSQTRDPPSPRNTVDIDKIANGMDTRTTIMIKNVPSRMTLTDMEAFINKICEREYDFLYLRMDFVTGNNVGYAFVNFIEVSSLLKFLQTYLGKRWNLYSSDKVMYAAYATYQGKAALVTKFQNSSILDREEKVKPHIYYSSGEKKGLPEPFPPPNDSARKARSLAAASEHGLFSRMEYNRRQQLSQHHSSSAADQSASTKLFASSPFATRSPVSSRKEHLTSAAQSGDTSEYYTASSDPRSSSSYTSPRGFASPHHVSPSTPAFKANTSFGPGRYSARRSSEGPHTAMLGRRASATLIQSP